MKVQAAIMDDLVRVTGKKLDDLQAVMQLAGPPGWESLYSLTICGLKSSA